MQATGCRTALRAPGLTVPWLSFPHGYPFPMAILSPWLSFPNGHPFGPKLIVLVGQRNVSNRMGFLPPMRTTQNECQRTSILPCCRTQSTASHAPQGSHGARFAHCTVHGARFAHCTVRTAVQIRLKYWIKRYSIAEQDVRSDRTIFRSLPF